MIKVAINGFGRIGKTFLRVLLNDQNAKNNIKVVVINTGKGETKAAAYALKYDSVMGILQSNIEYKESKLFIDNNAIDIIQELDATKLPWKKYEIDWVVDCSGKFTKRENAIKHIEAGAKAVLISAPADGEDITIIPGVNCNLFDPKKHKIVSLGSCTTNALAPMVKVINQNFVIESACMTTVHAYTNSQALLDVDPTTKDMRHARAAALNIIPSSTGATKVIGKVIPEVLGKISGTSLRVPVPKVSIVDLVARVNKKATQAEVNNIFSEAAQQELKDILSYTEEPLVSTDFSQNPNSVIIDGLMTMVQDDMVKVFGWYDNEWGYCCRLKDFLLF